MGQIPVSNDFAKRVNTAAKEYAPDWVADIFVPTEIDPSDAINPIGMAAGKGSKLVQALMKRFKGAPSHIPDPPTLDPFGLEPKMDRREFFRRASGKRMHDTNKILDHLDEKVHAYDPALSDSKDIQELLEYGLNEKEARNVTATNRLWHKMMEKYWPVDNSYADPGRSILDTTKRAGRALGSNFNNEIKHGLVHDAKESFEKGLDEAGETTTKLIDALLRRAGIRK